MNKRQTTGQVLAIDDASGKYHELIEFNNLQKQLQDLQKHGYQITSNTFNNQHYNVDKSQNLFEIHVIKHDNIKHDNIKHEDIKHEDIKHEDSLIIRKVHKSEKTLPQTGAEDTRIPSVIGAISSLMKNARKSPHFNTGMDRAML